MKVSLNWLKDYVELPWSADIIVEKLAQLGFPVESVTKTGVQVSKVVAVKILSVSKHPNADRLQIAQVTDGAKESTIVCGAPNIAVGQIVPCALPGAKLPGGVEIVLSKIRGVESQGMLCSERELEISDAHAGILQLPANTPLGREVKDVLGNADVVFDIEVTPNRPDMLSHIGVARELAAAAQVPLKLPPHAFNPGVIGEKASVEIKEPGLCPRYTGKVFSGVQIKSSPDWMVQRLTACGIRSINNVVDITNYVLLEWGHPLHAFDLSKVNGNKIVVRRAEKAEKIIALDDKTYELEPSDLVIADAKAPVAIAGIMGGQTSGVTSSTTDLLLESAVFDRVTVRQTSRRLALRSESSIRFEKGTDCSVAEKASLRAAQLIQELAGGKAGMAIDEHPVKDAPVTVSLRKDRLSKVTGVELNGPEVQALLARLEMNPLPSTTGWNCTPASFRKDIVEEVDLIEEVVRHIGYDIIPTSSAKISLGNISEEYRRWDDRALVEAAKGFGFSETLTSSFCSQDILSAFGIDAKKLIALANPISKEETVLRPMVMLNLFRAAQRNLNHQRASVALFEIGNIFEKHREQSSERTKISFLAAGEIQSKSWSRTAANADIYYLKGFLESLAQTFKVQWELKSTEAVSFLHPYQAFEIRWRNKVVGWAGTLHPAVAQKAGLAAPCVMAEVDLAVFQADKVETAKPLPKYPFVQRDIAVLIDKSKTWEEIRRDVEKSGGSLLVGVSPFDVFAGGSLPPAQKSVAFHIRLQHPDHTLAESEITTVVDAIKGSLQKNCGAQPR